MERSRSRCIFPPASKTFLIASSGGVLVPRPRINLVLYYGVLGARAAWRAGIVPRRRSAGDRDVGEAAGALVDDAGGPAPRRARGYLWAELMRRTFGLDVLACPRCGGRLRLVALIEDAAVIARILRHLGLPTCIPAPRPARAPPRLVEGAGRPDASCLFDA